MAFPKVRQPRSPIVGSSTCIFFFLRYLPWILVIGLTSILIMLQNDIREPTTTISSSSLRDKTLTAPPNNFIIFEPQQEQQQQQQQVMEEKSFFDAGIKSGTDKVVGLQQLPNCLQDNTKCARPDCVREECRPWGHFYHTLYQQKFGKYTLPDTEPFQFLEIGFYKGSGYTAYTDFFSNVKGVELHSMEISCLEPGPISEGKWPWGNTADASKSYDSLREKNLLHCGDASNVTWLNDIYTKHMRRSAAPPLKIVVEDASHLAKHMVTSVFFWFPRIEPGGYLVVEDVQPIAIANLFRTQFLPQIMMDLHFCGDPAQGKDEPCFPTLYPLLQSIHCEMHICVFERNMKPAIPDLSLELSSPPSNALDLKQCYSFANSFGISHG